MEEILRALISNAGLAGAILAWHLLIVNRKLSRMEEAINRLTHANLLRLVGSSHIGSDVKEEAARVLKDNDESEEARKKLVL